MTRLVALIVVLSLLAPVDALAQHPQDDWNAVLNLAPKTPIKVFSTDGRRVIGSLETADAGRIVIGQRRGRAEALRRDEVREIRMRPRRSTLGSAGIGAVSGLALGAAVGGLAGCSGPCSGDERGQGIVLAGAFGGSVGFGSGSSAALRPTCGPGD